MTIYSGIFPLKMVIFHSYVSLPEGINWCFGFLSSTESCNLLFPFTDIKTVTSTWSCRLCLKKKRIPMTPCIILTITMAIKSGPIRPILRHNKTDKTECTICCICIVDCIPWKIPMENIPMKNLKRLFHMIKNHTTFIHIHPMKRFV